MANRRICMNGVENCCMPGFHLPEECHTPEMIEALMIEALKENELKKCPDCTLPILANEEFCRFCNHRLKIAGAGGVDTDGSVSHSIRDAGKTKAGSPPSLPPQPTAASNLRPRGQRPRGNAGVGGNAELAPR